MFLRSRDSCTFNTVIQIVDLLPHSYSDPGWILTSYVAFASSSWDSAGFPLLTLLWVKKRLLIQTPKYPETLYKKNNSRNLLCLSLLDACTCNKITFLFVSWRGYMLSLLHLATLGKLLPQKSTKWIIPELLPKQMYPFLNNNSITECGFTKPLQNYNKLLIFVH